MAVDFRLRRYILSSQMLIFHADLAGVPRGKAKYYKIFWVSLGSLLELSRNIPQNIRRVLGDAFGFWFGRRPNVHAHCDAGLGAFLMRLSLFSRCNALFYPVDEFPIFGLNFLQF